MTQLAEPESIPLVMGAVLVGTVIDPPEGIAANEGGHGGVGARPSIADICKILRREVRQRSSNLAAAFVPSACVWLLTSLYRRRSLSVAVRARRCTVLQLQLTPQPELECLPMLQFVLSTCI